MASGAGPCYIFRMGKLSPIESEFDTDEAATEHDRWFRAKVAKSLASTDPTIPHDEVMAEAKAIIEAKRRAATRLAR